MILINMGGPIIPVPTPNNNLDDKDNDSAKVGCLSVVFLLAVIIWAVIMLIKYL